MYKLIKYKDNDELFTYMFSTIFIIQILRFFYLDVIIVQRISLIIQILLVTIVIISNFSVDVLYTKYMKIIPIFFALIVLTLIIRLFFGQQFSDAISSFVTDFTSVLMMTLYTIIILNAKISTTIIKKILNLFLYFTLVFIVYAFIFQYYQIYLFIKAPHPYASNVTSFFKNRNDYGYLLFLFLSVYTLKRNYYKKYLRNKIYYFIFLMAFISIFMTLSRTSVLGYFTLLALIYSQNVVSFVKKYKYKKSDLFFIIPFFLFSIYILSFTNLGDILIRKLLRFEFKTTGRTEIWLTGINLWKKNFLFGVGSFAASDTIQYNAFHNTIIEILVRNGLIGAFVKVYFFIQISKDNLKYNNIVKKDFFYLFIAVFITMQFETRLLYRVGFIELLFIFIIYIFNTDTNYLHYKKGNTNEKMEEI